MSAAAASGTATKTASTSRRKNDQGRKMFMECALPSIYRNVRMSFLLPSATAAAAPATAATATPATAATAATRAAT